jgi:hypothetical protein
MAPRTPYFIDVGNNKVVLLQLVKTSISALTDELGLTESTNGEAPTGKTLVGKGRYAAMQNGCFGVNLVYAKTAIKFQTAKVLCSPTKADSIFIDAKTSTYAGKNIIEVRVPRRRIYTF